MQVGLQAQGAEDPGNIAAALRFEGSTQDTHNEPTQS